MNKGARRSPDRAPRESGGHLAAAVVFGIGVALVGLSLLRQGGRPSVDPAEFERRAEMIRLDVEVSRERERIASELGAAHLHAWLSEGRPSPDAASESITIGIPLRQQPYHLSEAALDRLSRRTQSKNETETRIRGLVQEDRDAALLGIQAERLFIADFVANARRAGWDVRVDKDLNIVYRRLPEAEGRQPSGRRPQGLPEPPPVTVPMFAPFCPHLT